MPARSFAIGKVPPETLARTVYPHIGKRNPRLLLGPGIGRDIAAIRNNPVLVLTTDPITGTSSRVGEHSVYINANDVATAGAKPIWYLCTILLPDGSTEKTLSDIMLGIDRAARKLGITLARGHTETTRGIDRPIIAGFMAGERRGRLLRAEDVRVGDMILLTKTAGLEGTAILASDYSARLHQVPEMLLSRARRLLGQISIVEEALSLSMIRGVRVMHDPTEGGVLNACWEIGEASRLGVEVWADKIPVAEETRIICSKLKLDPLKLMSSGCLLAVVAPRSIDEAIKSIRKHRTRVSIIGAMTSLSDGRKFSREGKTAVLRPISRDELYKLA